MKNSRIILIFSFLIVLISCSQRDIKVFEDEKEMVKDAKSKIEMIALDDFKKVLESKDVYYLIDCREEVEYDSACIPGAINIPRGLLEFQIGNKVPGRRKDVYLYCSKGDRSTIAASILPEMKFTNVKVLESGFDGWKEKFPELIELEPVGSGAKDKAPPASSGGCGG